MEQDSFLIKIVLNQCNFPTLASSPLNIMRPLEIPQTSYFQDVHLQLPSQWKGLTFQKQVKCHESVTKLSPDDVILIRYLFPSRKTSVAFYLHRLTRIQSLSAIFPHSAYFRWQCCSATVICYLWTLPIADNDSLLLGNLDCPCCVKWKSLKSWSLSSQEYSAFVNRNTASKCDRYKVRFTSRLTL